MTRIWLKKPQIKKVAYALGDPENAMEKHFFLKNIEKLKNTYGTND